MGHPKGGSHERVIEVCPQGLKSWVKGRSLQEFVVYVVRLPSWEFLRREVKTWAVSVWLIAVCRQESVGKNGPLVMDGMLTIALFETEYIGRRYLISRGIVCPYQFHERKIRLQSCLPHPSNRHKNFPNFPYFCVKTLEYFLLLYYLYSYYFTGLFWSLSRTYGLSFRPRALKFSAKFAVVIRKNRKNFFFGSDPRGQR